MNPTFWGVIISGVVAVGGVFGTILARRGTRGDQELQSFSDQFGRMLEENKYLTSQLGEARSEVTRVRTEWEQRWDRQIARCRTVTDQAAAAIARLMGMHTLEDERDAQQVLRDTAAHIESDHTD